MRDGWTGDALGAALQALDAPLQGAMYTVWLYGNWRSVTEQMDAEQREAAAEAVERHHTRLRLDGTLAGLRWWR